jgi:hypothetical protein
MTPAVKKDRKEKRAAPPPRSHWQTVAGMLGIGSVKTADDEASESAASFADDSSHSPEAPTPASTADVEQTPKRSFWGRRTPKHSEPVSAKAAAADASPELAEESIGRESSFGSGVVESSPTFEEESSTAPDLGEQLGGDFEPDKTELRQAESKSVLDTLFTPSDESYWQEVDAEDAEDDAVDELDVDELDVDELDVDELDVDELDVDELEDQLDDEDLDDEDLDDKDLDDEDEFDSLESQDEAPDEGYAEKSEDRTDRSRGRRRRRSQQDDSHAERTESHPVGGERSRTGGDDKEGKESSGHRPRRRRRRRGGRSREGVEVEGASGREPDAVTLDAEDAVTLDAEDAVTFDAEDAACVIDAENRQGPSDSVLRMEASADLFDEPEPAAKSPAAKSPAAKSPARREQVKRREEASEEEGRRKHSIPSWEEAVGVIVQSNLDSRSESGSSNGNSRRRRGGRRRKPERRPRSDS